MSTRINIDANGFIALKQQADKVVQLNQKSTVNNSDNATLTKKVVQSAAGTEPPAAQRAAPVSTPSAGPNERKRNGVPSNQLTREVSAQRGGSLWGLWSHGWMAQVSVGDTGIAQPGGGTFIYSYLESGNLRFYSNRQNDSTNNPLKLTTSFPQGSSLLNSTGGTLGNSSNHNNLPIISNPFNTSYTWYTRAPIVASANNTLYGVQTHFYSKVNTPWSRTVADQVIPGNGVTYTYIYVYFRFNSKSGKLDYTSETVEFTNDPFTSVVDLTPYQEGGSVWAQKYAANSFSGDPSISLRSLGYAGDYHVKGSTAQFLRYNSSNFFYFNLQSNNARQLWSKGAELVWVSFPISYNNLGELKTELEDCLAEQLTRTHTIKAAFDGQKQQNQYNALSQAVRDEIVANAGDSFYTPTGPYVYPLVTPP